MNYHLPYEVHKQLGDELYEINGDIPQRLEKVLFGLEPHLLL